MSTKTSHRRQAHGRRTLDQFISELGPTATDTRRVCRGKCQSQCEDCHDIDNCVEASTRFDGLLLCRRCRSNYPAVPTWHVDPESGEFVDTLTGRVL